MIALQKPFDKHATHASPPPVADQGPETDPISAFVRRHQTGLCRFLRLAGAGAQAEEMAQEAFLVAIRRGVADDGPDRAAAFLRQTAKNLWLRTRRDDRRRSQRQAELAEHLWQQHIDPADDQGDRWLEALAHCRDGLPPRSRLALDRTYRDGWSRAQLAAELAIGEHGARSLLQRLRKTLKDCIQRRLDR